MADNVSGWTGNLGVSEVSFSLPNSAQCSVFIRKFVLISVAEMNITTKMVGLRPIIQTVQYVQRIQTIWKLLKNGNT